MAGSFYNLEGRKFGSLRAIKAIGTDTNGNKVWECLCDCGVTSYVRSTQLINERIISCRACGYIRAAVTWKQTVSLRKERERDRDVVFHTEIPHLSDLRFGNSEED